MALKAKAFLTYSQDSRRRAFLVDAAVLTVDGAAVTVGGAIVTVSG